jgi:hypothetical protein
MTHAELTQYKATKATVGAAISIVLAFLASLVTALTDNTITPVEWLIASIAALTIAGAVFGGVYNTTNAPKD